MANKPKTKNKNGNSATLGIEAQLWQAADKLRGHLDAAEYKNVVLGLIFLKYISDAFEQLHSRLVAKQKEGANPEDRDEYAAERVFWVPKKARWELLKANAKQPPIGNMIDDAMLAIEHDNPSLNGVLPSNYGRATLDKQRLGGLVDLISGINFVDEESRKQDVLGRVYEYFLSQFASAEGKKGGEFFTPRSVVRVLVEMLAPYKGRVFDPCCGSGGMFVQSEKFVEAHDGRIGDISIFGQESNPNTWKLAKMNLGIRGIEGDLEEPADSFLRDLHPDLKADFILANPPFNMSDWGGENLREDKRWKYGVPPVGNANFAWVQHFIHHLGPNGIAGFVLANVSLSSESNLENDIRKNIIEADLVDCIVTLPAKLFYSTPTPVCLWLVCRNKQYKSFRSHNYETLFIEAGTLGEQIDRTHNDLSEDDIEYISSTYHKWRSLNGIYKNIDGFCRSVSIDLIRKDAYTLFPGNYVGIEHNEIYLSPGTVTEKLRNKWKGYTDSTRKFETNTKTLDTKLQSFLQEGLIPDLSEFVTLKLGDILEPSDERLGDRPEPEILTCTERAGLILQRERFAKRVAIEDTSKYKLVRRTDIVYNPYLLWAGAIDQCWIVDIGITSPAYEVFRLRDVYDPTLIGLLLKSQKMVKTYNGISIGTIQRRRRAPAEKFLGLKVTIPTIKAQEQLLQLTEIIQETKSLTRNINGQLNEIILDLYKLWLSSLEQ